MTTRRAFNFALFSTIAGVCLGPRAATAVQGPAPSAMAIDCHAHVFLRDLPMPDRRRAPSGYDAPPEEFLRVLEANGMTNGVLVQPSFLGTDNSYLTQALLKYPGRFRGIAVVEPTVTGAGLDALQRAGVVGIRLNLVGLPTPDFASPQWVRLLQELRQRRWQVEVHQLARDLKPILDPLLSAGVAVVVDHFGRPDPALGVEDPGFQYLLSLGATRHVWVKLSGAYRNGPNGRGEQVALQAMPLLQSNFGFGQLVWGSDWPHTLFESTVKYVEQRRLLDVWIPEARDRQIVLRDTPARLFAFDK